jgi:lipid-binding SYLF domain-containing protein
VITVTGGSVGLQFGAKSSDVILVFRDAASIRKVYDSDFRIGGNVTATAGPEQAEAVKPTDTTGRIYSYTRSEGLFAGVALSGIKLAYDDEKTADLYGQKQITARQVFTSRDLKPPAVVSDLKQTLRRGASGN